MNSMPITAVVFMFIGFIMISAIGYIVCYFGGKHIGYKKAENEKISGNSNAELFKYLYSEKKYKYIDRSGNIWVITEDDNCIARFDIDWWNSPYKERIIMSDYTKGLCDIVRKHNEEDPLMNLKKGDTISIEDIDYTVNSRDDNTFILSKKEKE